MAGSVIKDVPDTASLTEKLQWLQTNAESNGEYTLVVTNDESIKAQTLSFSDKSNITVRLTGSDGEKIISLLDKGSLFTIESGVTLVLDSGITLKGHDENDSALVSVSDDGGGALIMNSGARIRGNTNIKDTGGNGGGVYIGSNGSFTMIGGEILDNNTRKAAVEDGAGPGVRMLRAISYSTGGGVSAFGSFTMKGGKIYNNRTDCYGGGVHVVGNFIMEGGEISHNKADYGGGVRVHLGGNFTMEGGKISNNNAFNDGGGVNVFCGIFTMRGGEISNNTSKGGGGVMVVGNMETMKKIGTFTMEGGKISDNTSNFGGGCNVNEDGSFIMKGGEISCNTANVGGGVYLYHDKEFTKTGGTIYGYTNGDMDSNKAQNKGNALYYAIDDSGYMRRENTAGPDVNMSDINDDTWKSGTTKSSGGGGGCYIATAVYNSYDAPEVRCLRRFRDEVLSTSIFGRLFISLYYFFSPPIAEWLKKTRRINMAVRKILDKVVMRLNKKFNN